MTFDDIVALDDLALNVAIERTCYGRTWHPVKSLTYIHGFQRIRMTETEANVSPYWIRDGEDPENVQGGFGWNAPPYNHFENWDMAMALAWKYAIGIWPLMATQGWLVQQPLGDHALVALSETETRRHICRLALWLALQPSQQESSL